MNNSQEMTNDQWPMTYCVRPKSQRGFFIQIVLALLLSMAGTMAGTFDVASFGAKGDGVAKDTAAVQKAIDVCTESGGGQVVLSKGTFLCGSLRLKSGVRFVVRTEARLLGSTNLADYTSGKLIHAADAHDITLEGGGIIDGQGSSFWERKPEGFTPKAPWQGTSQFQYLVNTDVPDETVKARYPEAQMFGRLPAYGLYARHVQGLTLSGVRLSFRSPDARSALVFDDVAGLWLRAVSGDWPSGKQPFMRFLRMPAPEISE